MWATTSAPVHYATSQKWNEPFQIFSKVITASHIETVRQVRHVTPPTVGREEILSHELGGGERHTGGNAVTRLVTKRRNVGITALSGSEYFRLVATCSHAQYLLRKKRSKNKNIFSYHFKCRQGSKKTRIWIVFGHPWVFSESVASQCTLLSNMDHVVRRHISSINSSINQTECRVFSVQK